MERDGYKATLKNKIRVPCSKCGKITTNLKKEWGGWFFVLFLIPYVFIFGINIASIIYGIMFLSVGLNWIITKPSEKIICEECMEKEREQEDSNKGIHDK